jgi:hypothetical protein
MRQLKNKRRKPTKRAALVLFVFSLLIYGGSSQAAEKEYWRNLVTATGKTKARAVSELIVKTEALEKVMFERCEKSGGVIQWSDVVSSGGKDSGRAEQSLICVERPKTTAWEAPENQVQ